MPVPIESAGTPAHQVMFAKRGNLCGKHFDEARAGRPPDTVPTVHSGDTGCPDCDKPWHPWVADIDPALYRAWWLGACHTNESAFAFDVNALKELLPAGHPMAVNHG